MQLITTKYLLKELPNRYKAQYTKNQIFDNGLSSENIIALLEGESELTKERANEIIGNTSWTQNNCDECGKDSDSVVQLGQEPDYDSSTANICFDCLRKAITLRQ